MKKILFSISFCLCFSILAIAQADKASEIFEQGRVLIHQGKFQETVELWKSIDNLSLTPDLKAKYNAMVGIAYRDSIKDNQMARLWFEKAISHEPQIYNTKFDSIDIDIIQAHMGLAAYADTLKQYDKAIDHYTKSLQLIHHAMDNRIRVIDLSGTDLMILYNTIRYGRAIAYGHNKDFTNATVAFDELHADYKSMQISDDSTLVTTGFSMGCMAMIAQISMYQDDKKDIPGALASCNTLVEDLNLAMSMPSEDVRNIVGAHVPFYLAIIARVYIDAGKTQEAASICDDALTWPTAEIYKPLIIDSKGIALLKSGQEEEARKCWLQVKELVPDFYNNDLPNNPLRDKFGKK